MPRFDELTISGSTWQCQRESRTALQIAAEKPVRGDAHVERRDGGVLDDGGAILFGEPEDTEDSSHTGRPLLSL